MKTPVQLPIRPHLLQYLKAVWQADTSKPIPLSSRSIFGHYIYCIIEVSPGHIKPPTVEGSKITVELTEYDKYGKMFDARQGHLFVSEANAKRFNNFLEDCFKKELFDFLDGLCENDSRKQIKLGIESFMNKHQLYQYDIHYESLKKAYYRHRKKRAYAVAV